MEKTMAFTATPLETRFSQVRTQETNFANFFADCIRYDLHADVSIINSGTIRSDCIFPVGKLTFSNLFTILPFNDIMVVIEVTGKIIHEALENGVS